jgi:diguanylate cyclase (GGDEF)-like protein
MVDTSLSSSLADIVAASGHIGYTWDLQTDHLIWFGPWQQLFGAERSYPPYNAETLAAAILPDDHYLVFNDGAETIDREYRLRRPDGRLIWVFEHGTTDHENGRAVRQRGLLRIIDTPGRRNHPLSVLAQERDPLTGRPTRATMLAELKRILEGPGNIKQTSAYLVVSIDKMSFVNEAVGTKAADALLCGAADRLAEMCPPNAIMARVGGVMFGVLLPKTAQDMPALADSLLQSFRDKPIITPAAPIHVTISIGSVRLCDLNTDAEEIMIRAEQALHEARQRGRNQYVEYRESAARAQENRAVLDIGERVKEALKNDKLRLAFQPIIDAESGRVLFYEALARLFRDDGSLMPAAEFVPVVEKQGLALEFDRHVLNLALREMEAAPELRLAVNISGLTAADAGWPTHMERLLSSRPNVAKRLIIEITETAAIMDVAETKRLVETLNQLGSQVALDDFGAGSTSIRHLRSLSLSIMKIDRELLLNLIDNDEQQLLVRMLIGLAHGLNLKTVAEGVETEEVAEWLRAEKVDMMQGYFFGRPSLEHPWRELKGAEATEVATLSVLGLPLSGATPNSIHTGVFE